MDDPLYDRQLDALPAAAPEAAKGSSPRPGGPSVGHHVALGVVGGVLATAPLCVLWVHGDETCPYLLAGLLLFIGLDVVLLGLVTRRPELSGWIHVGPQAVGVAVCLAAMATTAGWRAALAEFVTVPCGVSFGNIMAVAMTSRPGKQPGEAMMNLAAIIFVVLIFAYIPFQGLVERDGKPPDTPRPGGGKPSVVGPKAGV